MPELHSVARHFDDTKMYDGYTNDYLFKGQFANFLESAPDGTVSQRRVLSLAPDLALPARRVIRFYTERWLLGDNNLDTFDNRPIRQSIWMKKVTDQGYLRTPGQAALGSGGTLLYLNRDNKKYTSNPATDAEQDPYWMVHTAPSEGCSKGMVFVIGTDMLWVRAAIRGLDGLVLASCDQLDSGAPVAVSVATGALDLVADTVASGSVATTGFFLDASAFYRYETPATGKMQAGDMTLVVAKSAVTPTVGQLVTVGSRKWSILDRTDELDAWMLHVRLK